MLLSRIKFGNGPISMLVEKEGMSKAKASAAMKNDSEREKVFARFFAHTVDELIAAGRIVDTDGVLTLGRMPRGYDPIREDLKRSQGIARLNMVGARRKAGGWSNWTNALDQNVVAQMAETFARTGWPKGHTVLLDSDGQVADGKHHVAAAELVGIDWQQHTRTITDEIALWEEVEARNVNRWHGKPSEVAKKRAEFIALRADLNVGDRLEALRIEMAGVSASTQRRATAEVKKEVKSERNEAVKEALASGKSQRKVAAETGVSQKTVSRIAQEEEVSQNGQPDRNDSTPPAEVVGTCHVCKTDIVKGERLIDIILPEEGFVIGIERRKGGGGNAVFGSHVKTGQVAHLDCMPRHMQVGYRGR